MKKHYALVNYYGVNVSYESLGWSAHEFDTKEARDSFVGSKNESHPCKMINGGVARKSTKKLAYEMAGIKKFHIDNDYIGYLEDNEIRRM